MTEKSVRSLWWVFVFPRSSKILSSWRQLASVHNTSTCFKIRENYWWLFWFFQLSIQFLATHRKDDRVSTMWRRSRTYLTEVHMQALPLNVTWPSANAMRTLLLSRLFWTFEEVNLNIYTRWIHLCHNNKCCLLFDKYLMSFSPSIGNSIEAKHCSRD